MDRLLLRKNDGACLPGRASAHSGTEAAVGVVLESEFIQTNNNVKLRIHHQIQLVHIQSKILVFTRHRNFSPKSIWLRVLLHLLVWHARPSP